MTTLTLTPPAPEKPSYDIVVESGALKHVQQAIDTVGTFDAIFILYDTNLRDAAFIAQEYITTKVTMIEVPSGEQSKSLRQVEEIVETLLQSGATRQSLIISIGGGMMTDLGGFVASVFMRGIPFINIPTSFLGMVDAAIGGKTGVDLGAMKNMIGTYHHPRTIICDIDLLESLSDEHIKQGLVEAIKVAMIADANAFQWFEEHLEQILKRDTAALEQCVIHAAGLKGIIVQEDEKDHGKRMLLNFGHTVGHAVETLSHFSIPHGNAVSIGMMAEMTMANTKGADRMKTLLEAMERPLEIPSDMESEAIWNLMKKDKKSRNGVRMAVATEVGKGEVVSVTKEQFFALR